MTLDMTQYHDDFFDECNEALDEMESLLLQFIPGVVEPELINTVFRHAHSIKGGAATLGLPEIAEFTHTLETLLDKLRSNEMAVDQGIIDMLLASVDIVRDMIRAQRSGEGMDLQRSSDVQFDLEMRIAQQGTAPAQQSDATASPEPESTAAAEATDASPKGSDAGQKLRTYDIRFQPDKDVLRHGHDPIGIISAVDALGSLETRVDAGNLPTLPEMDPESCYLGWDLQLKTELPAEQVGEPFAWIEDECELMIRELVASGEQPDVETEKPKATDSAELEPSESEAEEQESPAPEVSPQAGAGDAADPNSGTTPATVQTADKRADTPSRSPARKGHGQDSGSIRVSIDKIDDLMNTVGELVITQAMLAQTTTQEGADSLQNGLAHLERHTRELQESVMRIRMLPIGSVLNRFPRLVRDLNERLGKEVELEISGETTELDKTVIERIGDPLVHLVRNALDHGIEPPADRIAKGKSATGHLHINAYHHGGNIVIEVSDDGRGLDTQRIFEKAVERALVQPNAQMSNEQIYDLLFLPGFSTASQVSDVSGRGVGMDVVRRNIQELGGSIEVASKLGQGSTFTVRLPLTLAILDGQTLSVGEERYIIPLVSIIESIQVEPALLNLMTGTEEIYRWRDKYLPIIRLDRAFGTRAKASDLAEGLLVVVEGEGRHVGLFVDELLGQQQVVIKSLETNFRKVGGISGATILGDGSVALIIDIPGLIRKSNQENMLYEHRKRA